MSLFVCFRPIRSPAVGASLTRIRSPFGVKADHPGAAPMTALNAHNRKYLIAASAVLAVGVSAFGLGAVYYPALGPIAGTIAPQLYVDTMAGAQIPAHGPYVLVDANSARLYLID